MRKFLIIILIITVSLYIIGWNGKKKEVTEDKWNNIVNEKVTEIENFHEMDQLSINDMVTEIENFHEMDQLSINDMVTCNENICIRANNPFFYKNDNVYLNATITYYDLEEEIVRDGTLNMKLVKNYENGDLFKLSVDDKEKIQECLSEDRLNIYFYVTDDKIYRLWSYMVQDGEVIQIYNDDDVIVKYLDTDDKLIAKSNLVCCEENVSDELAEGDIHVTISHQNNLTEYHRVELQEDGRMHYYESFVWEKGKGLVEYRSGFRIEADILYMENINQVENVKIEESVDPN